MAITDESRHQLHTRLDELLGHEAATTLMAHLPPVGWADVGTKHDLDLLEARIDTRLSRMETLVEAKINAALIVQTRVMIFTVLAAIATVTGLVAALLR